MLDFGKKIRALRNKKINNLTLVLSEKIFLNETKNHTPPWSVPYLIYVFCELAIEKYNECIPHDRIWCEVLPLHAQKGTIASPYCYTFLRNYHRILNISNSTDATSGTGTAYVYFHFSILVVNNLGLNTRSRLYPPKTLLQMRRLI